MEKERREKVMAALVEFIERASKKEATEAEIAVLPTVAKIVLDSIPRALH